MLGRSLTVRGKDRRGVPYLLVEAQGQHAEDYLEHLNRICAETPYMLQAPSDSTLGLEAQFRMLERLKTWKNCVCLLILRPDQPRKRRVVGSATLLGGRTSRTAHACTLGMGVDREEWGCGLGSALLDNGLVWARTQAGVTRVGLKVFEDNVAARRLYDTRGFLVEGELRNEVALDGQRVSLVAMGLDVT